MMVLSPFWLVAACLSPLMVAILGWYGLLRKALPTLGILAVMPAVWAAFYLPEGTLFVVTKGHLETSLYLDAIARAFLQFTSVAWLLASGFGWFYLREHPRRATFWLFFLTTLTGNIVLILAGDAVSFYSGFALMGFAAWGLVSFEGNSHSIRAGRLFLTMVVLGEALLLPGVVKAVLLAGSTNMELIRQAWTHDVVSLVALGFLFVGFGIKAGMVPFHFWLPVAHPVAPTPASAVLSGCMIKAGILGWLRFLPTGTDLVPQLTVCFAVLGTLGLLGGSIMGLFQKHVKTCLAYSTIQAAGMLMLLLAPLFSTADAGQEMIMLVVLYASFHTLHKTALFLSTALFPLSNRYYALPLLVLGASYAGLPWLAGDQIKSAIKPLLELYPAPWLDYMPWILSTASLLIFTLIGKVVWMLSRKAEADRQPDKACYILWLTCVVAACLPPLYIYNVGKAGSLSIGPLQVGLFALASGILALILRFEKSHPGQKLAPGGSTLKRHAASAINLVGDSAERIEKQLAGPAGALAVLGLLLALLGLQVIGSWN